VCWILGLRLRDCWTEGCVLDIGLETEGLLD